MRKLLLSLIAGICSLWATATTNNIAPLAHVTASAQTDIS